MTEERRQPIAVAFVHHAWSIVLLVAARSPSRRRPRTIRCPRGTTGRRRRPSSASSRTSRPRGARISSRTRTGSPRSTTTARSGRSNPITTRSRSRSTGSRPWPPTIPSGRTRRRSATFSTATSRRSWRARPAIASSSSRPRTRGCRPRSSSGSSRSGSRRRGTRASSGRTRSWPIGRCRNCSRISRPAGSRLVHRLRRRRRVHAALGRAGVRHPPRAGDRQQHQGEIRARARTGRR